MLKIHPSSQVLEEPAKVTTTHSEKSSILSSVPSTPPVSDKDTIENVKEGTQPTSSLETSPADSDLQQGDPMQTSANCSVETMQDNDAKIDNLGSSDNVDGNIDDKAKERYRNTAMCIVLTGLQCGRKICVLSKKYLIIRII